MAGLERRNAEVELRAVEGRKLVGYAAVFDAPTVIGGSYTETIRSGAFKRSLASGRDILGLLNHDIGTVLARTKSGSLKLSEDSRGLSFELSVPNTSAGRDVLELAERRDLGGASFAFQVAAAGEVWSGKSRELRDVDLFEVSIITSFPAYAQTEVHARRADGPVPRAWLGRRFIDTVRD